MAINSTTDKTRFLKGFETTEAELPNFKCPRYAVPEMKKSLNDVIDEYFEDILAEYRRTLPEPDTLRYNNGTEFTGRHISPGIVSITDVVVVNLVCDVIDCSYSASDTAKTAQQAFTTKNIIKVVSNQDQIMNYAHSCIDVETLKKILD